MSIRAAAARRATIISLERQSVDWEFLWNEYQASRQDVAEFWRGTVRAADKRIQRAIDRCAPFNRTTAAARSIDPERSGPIHQTMTDYGEIQQRHAELVDRSNAMHMLLLVSPAPDPQALKWKIEQVLGMGLASRATRQALIDDARRLLGGNAASDAS